MVCLQRHIKVFRYITAYGGKCLKSILTYLDCTKYNEIDMCHFDVQNHTSYKNSTNCINILNTGLYKSIPVYYGQQVKNFKSAFKYSCIELNKE